MADLSPQPDQDAILTAWCAELVSRLALDGVEVDVDAVLGLAGQVAHAVVRPAAPLTAFVVGYAAGLAVGRAAPTNEVASQGTFTSAFESAAATARDTAAGFAAAS